MHLQSAGGLEPDIVVKLLIVEYIRNGILKEDIFMLKRLVVAAVAMMSSYMAFAQYQQDLFSQSKADKVEYMTYSGGRLYLGGRMIADEYAWEHIGRELYETTYRGARMQYRAGKAMTIVGSCLTGLGLGLMIGGVSADDEYAVAAGAVSFALAQPVLGGGIAFLCVGKGRLNWLAQEYNYNAGKVRQPQLSFGATRSGFGLALNF